MRRSSYWRQQARATIDRVTILYLKAHPERPLDIKRLKAEIRSAYPFGERKNYPYKVWCEEVRDALSFYQKADETPKSCPVESKRYRPNRTTPRRGKPKPPPPVPPGQLSLNFDP